LAAAFSFRLTISFINEKKGNERRHVMVVRTHEEEARHHPRIADEKDASSV
jgi:hypothetical protein